MERDKRTLLREQSAALDDATRKAVKKRIDAKTDQIKKHVSENDLTRHPERERLTKITDTRVHDVKVAPAKPAAKPRTPRKSKYDDEAYKKMTPEEQRRERARRRKLQKQDHDQPTPPEDKPAPPPEPELPPTPAPKVLDYEAVAKKRAEMDEVARRWHAATNDDDILREYNQWKRLDKQLDKMVEGFEETLYGPLKRIDPEPSDVARVNANPKFNTGGSAYQTNCQRVVSNYELRRRGYDVEAMPRTATNGLKDDEILA
ncbi:hypothetical protein Q7C20_26565, partial [Pseudomonas sp. AMR01]